MSGQIIQILDKQQTEITNAFIKAANEADGVDLYEYGSEYMARIAKVPTTLILPDKSLEVYSKQLMDF